MPYTTTAFPLKPLIECHPSDTCKLCNIAILQYCNIDEETKCGSSSATSGSTISICSSHSPSPSSWSTKRSAGIHHLRYPSDRNLVCFCQDALMRRIFFFKFQSTVHFTKYNIMYSQVLINYLVWDQMTCNQIDADV